MDFNGFSNEDIFDVPLGLPGFPLNSECSQIFFH